MDTHMHTDTHMHMGEAVWDGPYAYGPSHMLTGSPYMYGLLIQPVPSWIQHNGCPCDAYYSVTSTTANGMDPPSILLYAAVSIL